MHKQLVFLHEGHHKTGLTVCQPFLFSRFADSTMSKLRWAVTLFKDWQSNRNKHALDPSNKLDISPIMVSLEDMTIDEINYSVSRFICEVKKMDGTEYPADTLYSLVISVQLYMDSIGKPYKFLNDESFIQIKNTLDNVMKCHARDPDARPRKQAAIITLGEEDFLWSKGVLGSENAKQLLNTMVYLIGLNFALRGGQEHRTLSSGPTSQLKLRSNEHGQYLSYTEDVSKTNQGGLKHRKCSPKSVVAFENTENPTRYIVKLYEKYISHCPVPSDDDAPFPFYLRPLEKPRGNIWYSNQCVGRHKLAQTVADICKKAGLSGYRTNHSLRASAATRMFDAEVDEQLICEVTGHRSNAVRSYKRTNAAQKRKLSSIVQGQGQSECASSSTKSVHSEVSRENNGVSLTVNISVNKN